MSWSAIIKNASDVIEALGFERASDRTSIEQQAEGGGHRRFQVSTDNGAEVLPRLAILNNKRSAVLTVAFQFYRGGGNAGGDAGGDYLATNAAAVDAMCTVAKRLEHPETYDPGVTHIIRRVFREFHRAADLPKGEVWAATFLVEYDGQEDSRVAE